jgi:hypothetical protein
MAKLSINHNLHLFVAAMEVYKRVEDDEDMVEVIPKPYDAPLLGST